MHGFEKCFSCLHATCFLFCQAKNSIYKGKQDSPFGWMVGSISWWLCYRYVRRCMLVCVVCMQALHSLLSSMYACLPDVMLFAVNLEGPWSTFLKGAFTCVYSLSQVKSCEPSVVVHSRAIRHKALQSSAAWWSCNTTWDVKDLKTSHNDLFYSECEVFVLGMLKRKHF